MDHLDRLKKLYDEVLGKAPFPTEECGRARITGAEHCELILYLADIAGLTSRGEKGLAALPEGEKAHWRKLALRSISMRLPAVQNRIIAGTTPKLHALTDATERARILILDALRP